MKTKIPSKSLALAAMVAAVYTVLCLAFPLLSYGQLQIRFAEALTLLAVFSPTMVVGVTLGCGVTNFVGVLGGLNQPLDLLFGTVATGLAAIVSYQLRNVRFRGYPFASALPPIIFNALILSAEFTILYTGGPTSIPGFFALQAVYIALGQLIPCLVLGPLLVVTLERSPIAQRYLTN